MFTSCINDILSGHYYGIYILNTFVVDTKAFYLIIMKINKNDLESAKESLSKEPIKRKSIKIKIKNGKKKRKPRVDANRKLRN